MIRILSIVLLSALGSAALANQMLLTPPNHYVVTGDDAYGENAYEIRATLDQTEKTAKVKQLSITIYDHSISVPSELLEQVVDLDFGSIKVINDIGIFGSYFYIDMPFGEVAKCRAARKKKLTKTLHISSLDTMDEGGTLTARINDPCD